MLTPSYSKKFEKDLKKMIRRGKRQEKIKKVMRKLVEEIPLENKYYEHKLIGNYDGRWECHIEGDWLLIYKKEKTKIFFERTGTHSDLFS